MVSLGIVGMGYMGHVHLAAARQLPGVQVVAVASRRPDETCKAVEGLDVYASYEELLEEPRLDAVVICLPTFLHEQYVAAAALKGRHILCEKPFALEPAAAERMLATTRRAGVILMIGQVLRFWPQYIRIKELVEGGEVGSVRTVTAFRLAKYPHWGVWFRDPTKSGGCLLDLHVHEVDFVHWLLGQPQSVFTTGVQAESGSWDHVFTTLTYSRAVVQIESSFLMPDSWPFATGIRVLGKTACIEYNFRVAGNVEQRAEALNRLVLHRFDGAVVEPEVRDADCFVAQLRYFTDCVEKQRTPDICPPEETLAVMRVMSACRESVETGRRVFL